MRGSVGVGAIASFHFTDGAAVRASSEGPGVFRRVGELAIDADDFGLVLSPRLGEAFLEAEEVLRPQEEAPMGPTPPREAESFGQCSLGCEGGIGLEAGRADGW